MVMTPKEKSIELIDKYSLLVPIEFGGMDKELAKKCALLSVDDILQTFNVNWQWCSVSMEDKALWSKEFEFWKEVKKEIELL